MKFFGSGPRERERERERERARGREGERERARESEKEREKEKERERFTGCGPATIFIDGDLFRLDCADQFTVCLFALPTSSSVVERRVNCLAWEQTPNNYIGRTDDSGAAKIYRALCC